MKDSCKLIRIGCLIPCAKYHAENTCTWYLALCEVISD